MITHKDHSIIYDGRRQIHITLPCFSGSGMDFSVAFRMNTFMEKAAETIYLYALSLFSDDSRRSSFICESFVAYPEKGMTDITLRLSFRQFFFGREPEKKIRTVCYKFHSGYVCGKKIEK